MPSRVAAMLLAAGRSSRMGCCKQLLPLGDGTVLDHCLAGLRGGGITNIVLVIAPDGEAVAQAAEPYAVTVVVNRATAADMASSVREGRDALPPGIHGVVVAPGDYPLVRAETVRQLIAHQRQAPGKIVIPTHNGRRGHPLLFPWPVLAELDAGETLRDLVRRDPSRCHLLAVDDPGILRDLDTPEDYLAVTKTLATTRPGEAQAPFTAPCAVPQRSPTQ